MNSIHSMGLSFLSQSVSLFFNMNMITTGYLNFFTIPEKGQGETVSPPQKRPIGHTLVTPLLKKVEIASTP